MPPWKAMVKVRKILEAYLGVGSVEHVDLRVEIKPLDLVDEGALHSDLAARVDDGVVVLPESAEQA